MPELDRHAHVAGKLGERGVEAADIGLEVRRQLQEQGSALGAEGRRVLEEPLHWLLGVVQALDVAQVPAQLRHDDEAVGRAPGPLGERVRSRQPVERVVDFDRAKAGGVVLQPTRFGKVLRVELAPPAVVLPSGRAHEDGHVEHLPRRGSHARRP